MRACKVQFISDSGLDFEKATGGLGHELFNTPRLRRFSMVVEDGIVRRINVEEPENSNNLGVSGVDHMLHEIDGLWLEKTDHILGQT